MIASRILLFLAFLAFDCVARAEIALPNCGSILKTSNSMNVAVKSSKRETGDWVTAFSAWKDSRIPSSNVSLEVTQKVFDCEGRHIVFIQGVVSDLSFEYDNHRLRFHHKCGKNVAISNEGRTVQKISLTESSNGVAITNRPLKNNELFEVRLEEKNSISIHAWGIGVTIYAPESIDIPRSMDLMKSGNWMMHHDTVITNGTKTLSNYGRPLDKLSIGDRIGVMRNNHGILHFFINGVDQGPAASNIPYPVYGVFELWASGVKGSIVDSNAK